MKGVTILDVARTAQVSTTSVSNYLNGRHDEMGGETRARIASAIETLGYVPNRTARQLKTGQSTMLGLLVPSVANPYFAELAVALDAAAQKRGLRVLECNTQRDPARELAFVRELVAQGVRGFISATVFKENFEPIGKLVKQGLAFVSFENLEAIPELEPVDVVTVDHELAVEKAVDYLHAQGHRAIAYASLVPLTPNRLARLRGYRNAMRRHGLGEGRLITNEEVAFTEAVHNDASYPQFGRALALALACEASRPTALVTVSDLMAIGVLSGLQEAGLRVPEDMAVVGVDGIALSAFTSPALTTVQQPCEAIAEAAIERICTRLASPPGSPRTFTVLEPELVVRASAACLSSR